MIVLATLVLGFAAIPFIYYALVLFSAGRYFRKKPARPDASFTPPVSNLKPMRGVDPDAYENLASFCRQDYPEYEIVLCVDEDDGAVMPVVERLRREFPERRIRVLHGSGRIAKNDKVAKLARMVSEAEHEVVVISDSDVRVAPDYLRTVVAPLKDPGVGAVTCFYVPSESGTATETFIDKLQTVGMMSDFYAGILVAWQLDGVKFALGPTIVTTRSRLAGFGGYQKIENRPADDLLVGRLIAEQGYKVELLRYSISSVPDYRSLSDLWHKRLRWIVVMRHMRPAGHFGLLFTQGLPWAIAAILTVPTAGVAVGYLGGYFLCRAAMTWLIGIHGLKQRNLWSKMALIPVWDVLAFAIWVRSFVQRSVRWRGADYYIRDGELVQVDE